MKIDDGALVITGGTFREPVIGGTGDGAIIGEWTGETAVFDGSRLLYIYNLEDNKTRTWKGIVRASLRTADRTPTFEGTWQVFGTDVHRGEIRLTKTPR